MIDRDSLTPENKSLKLMKSNDHRIGEMKERIQDHNKNVGIMKKAKVEHGWKMENFNKISSGFIEILLFSQEQGLDPRGLCFNIVVPRVFSQYQVLDGLNCKVMEVVVAKNITTDTDQNALEISVHMEDVARFLKKMMSFYRGNEVSGDIWVLGNL